MQREDLAGTYKLVSWQRPLGTFPFGQDAKGSIQYDPDGRMNVQIMKVDRPALGRTLAELLEVRRNLSRPWKVPWGVLIRYLRAATSYVAYSGTYDLQGEDVHHHLGLSLIPDLVGSDLIRHVELDGKSLILRSDEGDVIEWERVPEGAGLDKKAESTSA